MLAFPPVTDAIIFLIKIKNFQLDYLKEKETAEIGKI